MYQDAKWQIGGVPATTSIPTLSLWFWNRRSKTGHKSLPFSIPNPESKTRAGSPCTAKQRGAFGPSLLIEVCNAGNRFACLELLLWVCSAVFETPSLLWVFRLGEGFHCLPWWSFTAFIDPHFDSSGLFFRMECIRTDYLCNGIWACLKILKNMS